VVSASFLIIAVFNHALLVMSPLVKTVCLVIHHVYNAVKKLIFAHLVKQASTLIRLLILVKFLQQIVLMANTIKAAFAIETAHQTPFIKEDFVFSPVRLDFKIMALEDALPLATTLQITQITLLDVLQIFLITVVNVLTHALLADIQIQTEFANYAI
jgi:hypothetical protein